MNNFKVDYEAVFTRVCSCLGSDWRLDKRDTACSDRLVMINPNLKGYQLIVRMIKNRLNFVGFCRKANSTSSSNTCTASPKRSPADLARHIQKAILTGAPNQCAELDIMLSESRAAKERKMLLLHLLSKTASITPYQSYYNHICEIKAGDKKGELIERSNGLYELRLIDLTFEQLLRLVGQLAIAD